MIVVFVSYLLILYIALGMGLWMRQWINLEKVNVLFTILIGFLILINIATFYAISFPINYMFMGLILCLSTASFIYHRNALYQIINKTRLDYLNLPKHYRLIFWVLVIVSLLHTSSSPTLADNESYYIQTIKWLNEYGLVKGLGNLHLFLGQASGWHLLQSSLNFKFLNNHLNDLNGFLIILAGFFSLTKLNAYHKTKDYLDLFMGLILLSVPGQFLFIDSPSTDLSLLLVVPIITYLFLKCMRKEDDSNFLLMFILTLLVILVKVTIAPVLILPLIILLRYKKLPYHKLLFTLSSISLIGFITKNLIITGYPFYPLSIGSDLINIDWKLNKNIQDTYYQWITLYAWKIDDMNYFESLGFFEKFMLWLNQSGINGIMNKAITFIMIAFPMYFYKKRVFLLLYISCIIQFIIFYLTSPQYRFFLPVLLIMGLLFIVEILKNHLKYIPAIISINLIFLVFTGIFGFNLTVFSNNPIMQERSKFKIFQLIYPQPHTQFPAMLFKKEKVGNLIYYTPDSTNSTFYQTSDGPLPSSNKTMIKFFAKKYKHIPQLRTQNIKDGFYMKPIEKEKKK
ncbi:hypothetical protein GO491_05960 [Flavobacteriaceae bacterium Ap0902]|nr:hypothetical protein [Flavobacteriaceae bacterium Ap0902]